MDHLPPLTWKTLQSSPQSSTQSNDGFSYIKLCNPTPDGCDTSWHSPCKTPGKVPLSKDWNHKGSNLRPAGNAGIIVGKEAGYLVFDVDREAEAKIFENWKLPATRTHKTGKGRHYFYAWPSGVLDTSTGELKAVYRLPGRYCGILIRGSRAPEQVVAPGSVHENGFVYSVESDAPIASLPESFVRELVEEEQQRPNFGPLNKLTQGNRHLGFFSMASRFRYWDLPVDTAIAAALHFNQNHCEPPAPEERVVAIVEDAYNRYPATTSFLEAREYQNKAAEDRFNKTVLGGAKRAGDGING